MPSPGQQRQATPRLCRRLRLGQDARAGGDHGIGRQQEVPRSNHRLRLGAGNANRIGARRLGTRRGFVDLGGYDAIRDNPDLRQQIQPPPAGRSQNQRGTALAWVGYLKRKVMRPLLRS